MHNRVLYSHQYGSNPSNLPLIRAQSQSVTRTTLAPQPLAPRLQDQPYASDSVGGSAAVRHLVSGQLTSFVELIGLQEPLYRRLLNTKFIQHKQEQKIEQQLVLEVMVFDEVVHSLQTSVRYIAGMHPACKEKNEHFRPCFLIRIDNPDRTYWPKGSCDRPHMKLVLIDAKGSTAAHYTHLSDFITIDAPDLLEFRFPGKEDKHNKAIQRLQREPLSKLHTLLRDAPSRPDVPSVGVKRTASLATSTVSNSTAVSADAGCSRQSKKAKLVNPDQQTNSGFPQLLTVGSDVTANCAGVPPQGGVRPYAATACPAAQLDLYDWALASQSRQTSMQPRFQQLTQLPETACVMTSNNQLASADPRPLKQSLESGLPSVVTQQCVPGMKALYQTYLSQQQQHEEQYAAGSSQARSLLSGCWQQASPSLLQWYQQKQLWGQASVEGAAQCISQRGTPDGNLVRDIARQDSVPANAHASTSKQEEETYPTSQLAPQTQGITALEAAAQLAQGQDDHDLLYRVSSLIGTDEDFGWDAPIELDGELRGQQREGENGTEGGLLDNPQDMYDLIELWADNFEGGLLGTET